MKKLALIGIGTAGAFAATHFYKWTDWVIDWYFDPNIAKQAVGEGSTLVLPNFLYNNINFNVEDLASIDGTFKAGILKEGWGDGHKFIHFFGPASVSYHFNAVKLQNFIVDKLKNDPRVNIIEKNISDFDDVDSDYVLSCAGKPSNLDAYYDPESIPVNAVHVTQCYWDYPRFPYTLTIARPYGWVFGIPLKNRCSIGYMYNHEINTKEEVIEDVQEIFAKYDLKPSQDTNSFHFSNYRKKENFTDRVAYNGNASFFLEPLEATSIHTMDYINRHSFDIWNNGNSVEEANLDYIEKLQEIETVIMAHYAAGSIYNTPFWEFAQKRGIKVLENAKSSEKFRYFVNAAKEYRFGEKMIHDDYGTWTISSIAQNFKNLNLLGV